jgi:hypothetical protein
MTGAHVEVHKEGAKGLEVARDNAEWGRGFAAHGDESSVSVNIFLRGRYYDSRPAAFYATRSSVVITGTRH